MDGDIIDCVHKHKQPALDHPLLKNHKIQVYIYIYIYFNVFVIYLLKLIEILFSILLLLLKRVAPEKPKFKDARHPRNYTDTIKNAWQTWHHSGHCPKGTVPIRRSSVDDVLRAKSLYHYGKKQRRPRPLARSIDAPDVVSGNGHEVYIYHQFTFDNFIQHKHNVENMKYMNNIDGLNSCWLFIYLFFFC